VDSGRPRRCQHRRPSPRQGCGELDHGEVVPRFSWRVATRRHCLSRPPARPGCARSRRADRSPGGGLVDLVGSLRGCQDGAARPARWDTSSLSSARAAWSSAAAELRPNRLRADRLV
jgi:hypothetical protein